MKKIIQSILLLIGITCHAQLNVKSFGAKGDGVTDDTKSVNSALYFCSKWNQNLYFPPGNYLCNTPDANGNVLSLDASAMHSASIYGDSSLTPPTITTSRNIACTQLYVYSYAKCSDLTIKFLSFKNTHSFFSGQTSGIFLQGTSGQNLSNIRVSNCIFTGFANAIQGQGVNGLSIDNNYFFSPLGHDNAQNNNSPAVYIWLFDNQNGYCLGINIQNNFANGYSSSSPISSTVCKRPLDGFFYGTAYGLFIDGNITKNFGEEHICVQPHSTVKSDNSKNIISHNYIFCDLPIGCYNHRSNYGIRCDADNSLITKNFISNYTYGIMLDLTPYSGINISSYEISYNNLIQATDTSMYNPISAISLQGDTKVAKGIKVLYNNISQTENAGIITSNNISSLTIGSNQILMQ